MPKTAPTSDAAPVAAPEMEALAQEPAPATRRTQLDLIIAEWVRDRLYNSPLSRSTEAWNHLSSQLHSLASLLDERL